MMSEGEDDEEFDTGVGVIPAQSFAARDSRGSTSGKGGRQSLSTPGGRVLRHKVSDGSLRIDDVDGIDDDEPAGGKGRGTFVGKLISEPSMRYSDDDEIRHAEDDSTAPSTRTSILKNPNSRNQQRYASTSSGISTTNQNTAANTTTATTAKPDVLGPTRTRKGQPRPASKVMSLPNPGTYHYMNHDDDEDTDADTEEGELDVEDADDDDEEAAVRRQRRRERRRERQRQMDGGSFLSRSFNLSRSLGQGDSIRVKDFSMLKSARQLTRAQLRGMATMAATTATGGHRDSIVTPAAALVEMGGSGKVHSEEAEGSSTSQSIFNTVNLLLGLGLLSLPYALRCGGWLPGLGLLISTALITKYTALILAKCLDTQPGRLFDFADIGEAAFGPSARSLVSVLFISELYFTCVAFVILISDSLHALYPGIPVSSYRWVAFVVCTLSTWVRQLKYISYASLIGIFACLNLVAVVIYDGMTKTGKPGSLVDVEDTYLFPEKYLSISLSFGIVMAGFAGHAVLPNIYLDMKDKSKFPQVLNISFAIALTLYVVIAGAGYLMFGDSTLEEITKNLQAPGASVNPNLNIFTTALITFIPVPKFALTMAPVAIALDQYVGRLIHTYTNGGDHLPTNNANGSTGANEPRVSSVSAPDSSSSDDYDVEGSAPTHTHAGGHKLANTPPRSLQLLLRTLLALGTTLLPGIIPHFDVVLSLLGSIFSCTVSVVIPAACYLKLFGDGGGRGRDSSGHANSGRIGSGSNSKMLEEGAEDEADDVGERLGLLSGRVVVVRRGRMSGGERVLCWCLLVFGSVGAVVATIGSCVPGVRPV
ncbi:hypothetical protein HDU76_001961 [Blyttiomyces sp. JEL0837]|nr:hypothetical protein HDU76_001961 [Blyttiomyces sp. JEL0837]